MPTFRRLLSSFALLLILLAGSPSVAQEFLQPEEAFTLTTHSGASGDTELHWKIAKGYYLYRDRFAVRGPGGDVALDLPPGVQKDDPTFGITEIYHDGVSARISADMVGPYTVTWQGCAEAGICYPPQSQVVTGSSSAPPVEKNASNAQIDYQSDSGISAALRDYSLWLTIPGALLLGLALAFTPCMLPMLPIITSIVSGVQASPRRAAGLSVAYGLSMATTYAALGVGAAMAGASVQVALQGVWLTGALSLLFVVLACAMFGFYTLQLPAFLRERLDRANRHQQGGSWISVLVMGALTALLVGPCMTAPLAGTLLYIAQSGNAIYGALLLFLLGIGMGMPTVIVATFGSRLLPRPGMWMARVNHAFGFLLLATAIWVARPLLSPAAGLLLWGGWTILLGSALAVLAANLTRASKGMVVSTAAALGSLLWGALLIIGSASGQTDPLRPLALHTPITVAATDTTEANVVQNLQGLKGELATVRASGQPAVLVFSADWCVSCHELERNVFPQPEVQEALGDAHWIKMDVTDNTDEQRQIMRQYRVIGPPTLILLDAGAEERERLVGEFDAQTLLARYQRLKDAG
ncbi:protein-disulfide reductase DsbD [Achromobacter anxifer]